MARKHDDPWQHPDIKAWVADTQERLPGMINDSSIVLSIVPANEPDVKFAVELGMSIMLDKPLLCIVRPGTQVPDHLVRCADLIIECNMEDEADKERLAEQISAFMEKHTLS